MQPFSTEHELSSNILLRPRHDISETPPETNDKPRRSLSKPCPENTSSLVANSDDTQRNFKREASEILTDEEKKTLLQRGASEQEIALFLVTLDHK